MRHVLEALNGLCMEYPQRAHQNMVCDSHLLFKGWTTFSCYSRKWM